jgi:Lon protease-like protein
MRIIPTFPLPAVLFPGGKTLLQIFEPRYLSMVKACMKANEGFGVVLADPSASLNDPVEVGQGKSSYQIARYGTLCSIVDFDLGKNGHLQITIQGEAKFHIDALSIADDGLLISEVSMIAAEVSAPVPKGKQHLVELLQTLAQHATIQTLGLELDLINADQVGGRLVELLPHCSEFKQEMLELSDPQQRLEEIEAQLLRLQHE